MKKHMTQEVAIKSAWMILEGLGFSREINGDLEKTVAAVFESAPAADVVEVVRCYECKYWEHRPDRQYDLCAYYIGAKFSRTPEDFCSRGERKDGGQDDA